MSLDAMTLALAKSYTNQHSGGGEQVQPDWNQNDETAADYVKNKPFYKELRSVTVENVTDIGFSKFPIFAVGDTVTVNVDGVEYSLVAYDDDGMAAIGDPYSSIENGEGQLGWQFYVESGVVNFYAKEAHTVSYFAQEIVKIDEKYLPDTVATKSDVNEKLGNCIKTVNGTAPDASGNVEVQTISEDALSTNQYGTVIIVKNGVVFKNRLGQYTQMPIGESNVAFLVKEGETSKARDTTFAFAVATDPSNPISVDQVLLSRNGIDFHSENVAIRSFKPGNTSVDVIQLNSSTSRGVMVEITKNACFVLPSSTSGSTKKFKITVDDSGTLTAKEITSK